VQALRHYIRRADTRQTWSLLLSLQPPRITPTTTATTPRLRLFTATRLALALENLQEDARPAPLAFCAVLPTLPARRRLHCCLPLPTAHGTFHAARPHHTAAYTQRRTLSLPRCKTLPLSPLHTGDITCTASPPRPQNTRTWRHKRTASSHGRRISHCGRHQEITGSRTAGGIPAYRRYQLPPRTSADVRGLLNNRWPAWDHDAPHAAPTNGLDRAAHSGILTACARGYRAPPWWCVACRVEYDRVCLIPVYCSVVLDVPPPSPPRTQPDRWRRVALHTTDVTIVAFLPSTNTPALLSWLGHLVAHTTFAPTGTAWRLPLHTHPHLRTYYAGIRTRPCPTPLYHTTFPAFWRGHGLPAYPPCLF